MMSDDSNPPSTGRKLEAHSDAEVLRLLFQGKWRLPVLKEIQHGPCRLSQLRRAIPEATKKMLIDTLHALEGIGWVVRHDYDSRVKRVEYSIAEGIAEQLRKLIPELIVR